MNTRVRNYSQLNLERILKALKYSRVVSKKRPELTEVAEEESDKATLFQKSPLNLRKTKFHFYNRDF